MEPTMDIACTTLKKAHESEIKTVLSKGLCYVKVGTQLKQEHVENIWGTMVTKPKDFSKMAHFPHEKVSLFCRSLI